MGAIQKFDYSIDLSQGVLWQYNDAARLQALLLQRQLWYDNNQSAFWENWYNDVFNLETANDFGLSVWAIILNVPLVANSPEVPFRPSFGFGAHNLNFHDPSNFAPAPSSAIMLTTEQKRLILRLRYFQLITRGTPFEINAFLKTLFGDQGPAYVLDGLDMTCEYVFQFFPPSKILFVFEHFDILPRPAGVELRILVNPGDSFGFKPYYLNFHQSNFAGGA